jgi:hypothetical protein
MHRTPEPSRFDMAPTTMTTEPTTGRLRPAWFPGLWLSALLFLGTTDHARPDIFPDPAPEGPAGAALLSTGSVTEAAIEVDIDRDWYRLEVARGRTYTLTVTPVGLHDADVCFRGAAGQLIILHTTSVGEAASTFQWTHVAAPQSTYLDIGGFAQFTTGTYTVAVSEDPMCDTDNDGLPDTWELAYFEGLGQKPQDDYDRDTFTNETELGLGSDPTNSASRLAISGLARLGGTDHLTWQAAPLRRYTVAVADDPTGDVWHAVGVVTGVASTARFSSPVGSSPLLYYRVKAMEVVPR